MKTAECNKKTFYFRTYQGRQEILDDDGYETGSTAIQYGELETARGSISPNKGKASIEMFGSDLSYSNTIIVDDMSIDMDENSIVWIRKSPVDEPHDYVVVARAEGLTNISFAVRKVDVTV